MKSHRNWFALVGGGVRRPRWLLRYRVAAARPGTAKPFGIGHLGATRAHCESEPELCPDVTDAAAPTGPNPTRLGGAQVLARGLRPP